MELLCDWKEKPTIVNENAVAAMYDRMLPHSEEGSCQTEEFFWGYIPAKDNDVIAQFLGMCSESVSFVPFHG